MAIRGVHRAGPLPLELADAARSDAQIAAAEVPPPPPPPPGRPHAHLRFGAQGLQQGPQPSRQAHLGGGEVSGLQGVKREVETLLPLRMGEVQRCSRIWRCSQHCGSAWHDPGGGGGGEVCFCAGPPSLGWPGPYTLSCSSHGAGRISPLCR